MAYGAILHIIQTVFLIKILNHKYITFKLQHAYFNSLHAKSSPTRVKE